jgi:hypothetical protein
LNVDALSKNLVNLSKEEDDFGYDVMGSKEKLLSMNEKSPNDIVINLFTLQLMDKEMDEIEEHQMEVEIEE